MVLLLVLHLVQVLENMIYPKYVCYMMPYFGHFYEVLKLIKGKVLWLWLFCPKLKILVSDL